MPANASFLRTLNVCKYLNLGPAAVSEMDYSFFLKIEEYIKEENLHRKRQEEKDRLRNKAKKRR